MRVFNFTLFFLFSLCTLLVVQQCVSEKILVLSFFASKSHKITYMHLIEELARRGHNITIITPVKGKETKNIREIWTMDLEPILAEKFNAFEMKEKGQAMNPFKMLEMNREVCEKTYKNRPEVKSIINEDFDLVFMQPMFNECALGIVHRLKAPLVLFAPISAPSFVVNRLGGFLPTSFVPHAFLPYSDEMTFFQRFANMGVDFLFNSVVRIFQDPLAESIYRKEFGSDVPSVSEILGNASLILSNGHFSLSKPKPFLPDVIDVGGIHSKAAEALPKDLEDFISLSGPNGFILFSMGSAIKADQMPEAKRRLFLSVFSKLKQQVLWKWESEKMPEKLPKNVKLSKWLPQQDLLGHPNIKTFITHCGGGSTEEAIYHGVPLVGMPMFGDQIMNAGQAEKLGFLKKVDWDTLTEDDLLEAVQDVLENQRYREKAKQLSEIFKDQPETPLQRGVYWIEYVLRHKGAPQLRSASRKLNWFQYHSLDVISAYLAILTSLTYIIYKILSIALRKAFACLGNIFSGSNKNKAVVKTGKKTL